MERVRVGAAAGRDVFAADRIARQFVGARRMAQSLDGYPGPLPADLAAGYAVQEAAIALWRDAIVGWKIGRVPTEFEAVFGAARIAGPIFTRMVRRDQGGLNEAPVFQGGFAAVEAEYVFALADDAPPAKLDWTLDDAARIAGRLHIGVEIAGSPLATINALGPAVVVSDFGNNAGLILGAEIAQWRTRAIAGLTCETFIDGTRVGRGGAAELPGGPIEALRFLLEHCARRGRPLKAGMLISSGAATGIHDIRAGKTARVSFGSDGEIALQAVAAPPEDEATS